MRLTLRTLLAYLDDLLKPADAREIGRRLSAESPGMRMAEKIRDVLRRRRISAPEVDGNPDPNTVAEYLDNVLPDNQIESHERACLSSDETLAETAACHQILTLVMGKPIRVSHDLLERAKAMHVVEPPEDGAIDGALAASEVVEGVDRPPIPVLRHTSIPDGPADTLPDFLAKSRQQPTLGWVVGAAVSLVGAVLFFVLLQSDDAFNSRPGNLVAVKTDGTSEPVDVPDLEPKAADRSREAAGETNSAGPDEAVVTAATSEATEEKPARLVVQEKMGTPDATADPDNAVAKVSSPRVDPSSGPNPENMKPSTPSPAEATAPSAKPIEPEMVPANPQPTVPVEPPALEPFVWTERGSGLALSVNDELGGWAVVGPQAVVEPGARVIVPEPFTSGLLIDGGPIEVRILAGSDLTLLKPTASSHGGIHLAQGRVVIDSGAPADGGENVVLLVDVGSHVVEVELGPQSQVAVESVIEVPDKILEGAVNEAAGTIYVTRGPVEIRGGKLPAEVDGDDGVEMQLRRITLGDVIEVEPLDAPPTWVEIKEPSVLTRRYAALFEKLIPDDRRVEPDLRAALKEPTYRPSELAAATISIIGDPQPLVEALRNQHEETRIQAIKGLRFWLAADVDRVDELNELLAIVYRDATLTAISRLLVGYEREELGDPDVTATLLSDMGNDEIAVRELAFFHVQRFTGKSYDYRPNAAFNAREVALRRWHDHVDRDGALLSVDGETVPAPAEKASPDAAEASESDALNATGKEVDTPQEGSPEVDTPADEPAN